MYHRPTNKRHYRRTCSKYPVSFSLYFNLFCLYYPCFKDSAEYQTSVCTLSNFYRMYDRYDHGIFHRCHWKHVGNVKTGLVMVITMGGSFLSGLMAGNMRIVVDTYCPIINRINPTALISDMFYSLAIYDSLDRYFENLISLVILSLLFCIGGFLLTRRKKYANI